jgi:small subunit ribosomal protein S6
MPTYETVFITPPDLADEDERATVETMAQIVGQGGGTIIASDRMGRRRLAYPIRKHEDGVYVRFLYDSGADVPKELERRFRLSDNVLRYLTVTLEEDWAQAAKEQAARDAQRRADAAVEAERQAVEAERQAAEAAASEAARRPEETAAGPGDDEAVEDGASAAAAPTADEPGPARPEASAAEGDPETDKQES